MNYNFAPETNVLVERKTRTRFAQVYRFPSISIFVPFDPKMGKKHELAASLLKITKKASVELKDKFPGDMSLLVIEKLKAIIRTLDYNTLKKSLAIFISPVFEKVFYLNMDLDEKVIVSDSFQIRNILHNQKSEHKYYLLVLDDHGGRIVFSESGNFVEMNWDKIPVETGIKKMDQSLSFLFKRNKFPVFLMGKEPLLEEFLRVTENKDLIMDHFYGNYGDYATDTLKGILHHRLTNWQHIRESFYWNLLKSASEEKKLSAGTEAVFSNLAGGKGLLLLLSRTFLNSEEMASVTNWNDPTAAVFGKYSYIKNTADLMIEQMLENGGQVQLVPDELLKTYGHVALIM